MSQYYPMQMPEFYLSQGMTDQQKSMFLMQYAIAKKDPTVAILLAIFLGGFGAHRFYLGETGLGILYLLFCWTGIPHLIAWIECFLLTNRVLTYNMTLAQTMAMQIQAAYPGHPAAVPAQQPYPAYLPG